MISANPYITAIVSSVITGMDIRTLTEQDIQARLLDMGHDEITIDYSTYKNIDSKCRFIDSEFGDWWAVPGNVLRNGCRHPKRAILSRSLKRRVPVETIKQRIYERFGDLVVLDESTYQGAKDKARFIDKELGEFWARIDAVLISRGHPMRGLTARSKAAETSFEEASAVVEKRWSNEVVLLCYNGYNEKCLFRHAIYGEWEAVYANVVKGHSHPMAGVDRYKDTMKRLYGVEHPSQSPEIHGRAIRSTTNQCIVVHWKTNKPIKCTASYEYAVVNQLNASREDFEWQIPFDMEIDGRKRVYFCDLYLPERNLYVEIKGRFQPGLSRRKWETFHVSYPNSELWTLEKVLEFTGKTEYRITKDFKQRPETV